MSIIFGIYLCSVEGSFHFEYQLASSIGLPSSSTSFVGSRLLTALPQIPVAITNVLYNSSWSTIALCAEYQRYAHRRRGLRVSMPRGGFQRSTYRLSMPIRYVIPQTTAWATMHFLLSETWTSSITNVRDALGRSTDQYLSTYQWMPGTWLIAVMLYSLMFLALAGQALRKYRGDMPLASTCSAAISAACHPLSTTDVETSATDAVQYGHNDGLSTEGTYRAAFSSGTVGPLMCGVRYR